LTQREVKDSSKFRLSSVIETTEFDSMSATSLRRYETENTVSQRIVALCRNSLGREAATWVVRFHEKILVKKSQETLPSGGRSWAIYSRVKFIGHIHSCNSYRYNAILSHQKS
jgi:hypothetical protein